MTFPKTTALDLTPPAPLPEEVAELFAKCQEKLGLVPNVLVAYAHNPEKLRAFGQMYNTLMLGPSGLSKPEREMIAVAVSSLNHCWYCLVAHGAAVRVLSGSPELGEALVMNHRYAEMTPRQRAMIEFARKTTTDSAGIGEADRAMLRSHSFTEADIWDIAEVAAFFNMSNRLASAVGMIPNPEYHAQGRGG
ncbi:MAG TPA: peroxidase-related enzyme [Thermohalobaculum sp.]|nr:peroxidase-related enzyme [Thermohalobaculum sp.]